MKWKMKYVDRINDTRLIRINRKTLNAKVCIFVLQRKDDSSIQVRIQDTLIESSNGQEKEWVSPKGIFVVVIDEKK